MSSKTQIAQYQARRALARHFSGAWMFIDEGGPRAPIAPPAEAAPAPAEELPAVLPAGTPIIVVEERTPPVPLPALELQRPDRQAELCAIENESAVLSALDRPNVQADSRWVASMGGIPPDEGNGTLQRLLRKRIVTMAARARWVRVQEA